MEETLSMLRGMMQGGRSTCYRREKVANVAKGREREKVDAAKKGKRGADGDFANTEEGELLLVVVCMFFVAL